MIGIQPPRLCDPETWKAPRQQCSTADFMAVLLPIWNEQRETARRVRQRIGAIMKWAVAQGYRQDNPAGDAIGAALPKNGASRKHHRALPHAEVRDAQPRRDVARRPDRTRKGGREVRRCQRQQEWIKGTRPVASGNEIARNRTGMANLLAKSVAMTRELSMPSSSCHST